MTETKKRIWLYETSLLMIAVLAVFIWRITPVAQGGGKEPPYSGIVTGKEWAPKHQYPVIVGKMIILQSTPERFYLVVTGRRFEVSRAEFDRTRIKDEWTERR